MTTPTDLSPPPEPAQHEPAPEPPDREPSLPEPPPQRIDRWETPGATPKVRGPSIVPPPEPEQGPRPASEVRTFLRTRLADGPAPVETLTSAAAAQGITARQLRRSRAAIGATAYQQGGRWWWALPVAEDETVPPPVAHAPEHFRRDWLPQTELGWFETLRMHHVILADDWARMTHMLSAVEVERRQGDREYSAAVEEALRAGLAPPARPEALDPAIVAGRQVVARAAQKMAAEELGRHVVNTLAVLRRRRREIDPYMNDFSGALSASLGVAIGATRAQTAADLRRLADELDPPDEPALVVLDDEDPNAQEATT